MPPAPAAARGTLFVYIVHVLHNRDAGPVVDQDRSAEWLDFTEHVQLESGALRGERHAADPGKEIDAAEFSHRRNPVRAG